jgi:hypothetical protein
MYTFRRSGDSSIKSYLIPIDIIDKKDGRNISLRGNVDFSLIQFRTEFP